MRKAIFGIVMLCAGMAQAEDTVIVAFGDSLTQGYGLPVEDGFVPRLQGWLDNAGAQVRLINAGVSGDTTAGGLARVEWTLTPDVDGMIVALGANDFLRGLDPKQARQNIEGILKAAKAADVAVLLVGMQVNGNYGAAYQSEFEALYPELAAQYEVQYVDSFFTGFKEEGVLPEISAILPFLQADGLHPNSEGVERIIEGLGPHVVELVENLSD